MSGLFLSQPIIDAADRAQQSGRSLVAVMYADRDAIQITQQHTPGLNLAIGCAGLVKSVLGRLDKVTERKFLEDFVKELRS